MEHETQMEEGVSRRKFLKLSGLFGLALGALSLPSLSWGQATEVTGETADDDKRLAHKRRTKKTRARKRSKAHAAHGTHKRPKQTAETGQTEA